MADAESPARIARRLMREAVRASLATQHEGAGGAYPYVSLVLVACDVDLAPLLLISDLAEHTKNLRRGGRASLLFDETEGLADPLTGARVTVLGTMAPTGDPAPRQRYVARHPAAASYNDFHDFHLWRMEVERAHLVAGFGRIHWIEGAALRPDPAAATALAAVQEGILAHMNAGHAATIDLYAQKLLHREGTGWRIVGVDAEGADLRRDAAAVRLQFDMPASDPDGVRRAFIDLAKRARGEA